MRTLLLRSVLSFLATVISITAALSILVSPPGASGAALGVLVFFLPVALLTGPFWPDARRIEKWSRVVDRFPRLIGGLGYLVMAVVGVAAAVAALQYPEQAPRFRKLGLAYEALGEHGAGFVWFALGVGLFLLGLIGGLRALRNRDT